MRPQTFIFKFAVILRKTANNGSQCPLSGGKAVFAARSVLSLFVDTLFTGECATHGDDRMMLVSSSKNTTTDSLTQKLLVKMYPNPTKDYTVLQLNQDISPLQLQITDGLGRTIVNQQIATNNGKYTINTASFSSGLYYVALYSDNGKIFGGKLSVMSQ